MIYFIHSALIHLFIRKFELNSPSSSAFNQMNIRLK